jgi:hypothetical protein
LGTCSGADRNFPLRQLTLETSTGSFDSAARAARDSGHSAQDDNLVGAQSSSRGLFVRTRYPQDRAFVEMPAQNLQTDGQLRFGFAAGN